MSEQLRRAVFAAQARKYRKPSNAKTRAEMSAILGCSEDSVDKTIRAAKDEGRISVDQVMIWDETLGRTKLVTLYRLQPTK